MNNKKIIIAGAGITGLSTAYHLKNYHRIQTVLIEKNDTVGGTARSFEIGGFTFDITGHLLHLHTPYTQKLIRKLLKKNSALRLRKAAIYSKEALTQYPFQVNTYGLPKNVIHDCVTGFREAVRKYSDEKMRSTSLPFNLWSERTFGKGIHRYFMKPYNEKLWQVRLNEMTAEWCGMFVPQPKLEDVIQGSQKNLKKSFGYNVNFIYPKSGGIQVLSDAIAENLPIQFNTSLEEIRLQQKKARFSDGKWKDYNFLVSTIPLPELLVKIKDLPQEIEKIIPQLRWTSVLCVNLGINRPNISDKSWIYFPEKKFVFYRVGFYMNFSPCLVPQGHSSVYVEVSYPHHKQLDWTKPEFLNRIRTDLKKCGILKKTDKIVASQFVPIPCAYVIYTPERKQLLQKVFDFLKQNRIFSVGRYGGWKYSFMEEAILDGKKTAEEIIGLKA